MYGGAIYLRGKVPYQHLAPNIAGQVLQGEEELAPIRDCLQRYADYFNYDIGEILSQPFTRLTPVNQRLYKRMYTGFVS